MIDVTPMLANKTGIGYYIERLLSSLANVVPKDVEIVGFYYNFLGRRDASHLPQAKNISYAKLSLIPSKVVYQLRRWGIEFPVELFTLKRADFILYPNFLDHPSLFGTPSAPVIHDLTYLDLPQYVSPKLRRDLTRFVPHTIRRSEFVITVSEYSKARLVERYALPPEKILVTPIPPQAVLPANGTAQAEELQKLGLNKPYILFVGTIDPRKNVIGLIDGYTELPENVRSTYSLVLVGRTERLAAKEAARIEQAQSDGYNVIHLGYVSDQTKDALYRGASLFATASTYEGFGMPVLEAMSYGIPCVASDIEVFKEIGGEAVMYFDPLNPSSIADTMQRILENPEEGRRLGIAGKQHAAHYDWKKVATSVFQKIQASLPKK